LRTAAESAGVSQGSLDSSLERFSKRIGEAVQGSGAAKKALDQMGISAKTLASLGLDASLSLVADEMAKISDPTERAARAAALFGREGVAMVNLMREGSGGMAKMRAEARALGIVIDESLIRKAEESQTRLDLMSRVISAQLSQALINLAPLLVGAAENIAAITRAVNDFLNINFDMPELMDAQRLRDVAAGMDGVQSETMALSQATAAYNMNLEKFGVGSAQAETWLKRQEAARTALAAAVNKQNAAEASLQSAVEGGAALAAATEAAREKLRLSEMTAEAVERERISREKAAYINRIVDGFDAGGEMISDKNLDRVLRLADEFEAAEIAASKIINPVEAVGGASKAAATEAAEIKAAFDKAAAGAENLESMAGDAFSSIITGAESARDVVSNLLGQLAQMAARQAFSGFFGGSDIFKAIAPVFTGASFAPAGGAGSGAAMAATTASAAMIAAPAATLAAPRAGTAAGGAGSGQVNINISVAGARGNSEISEMVKTGVNQGLQEYDRQVLPRSMAKIQRDPRRIG